MATTATYNNERSLVGDEGQVKLNAGVQFLHVPITLASMGTGGGDLATNIPMPFRGKITGTPVFITSVAGTGSGATQTLNLEIGSTNVTTWGITITLASTSDIGEKTTGTAATALNEFDAGDTLSVEYAASGTVFTAGSGMLYIPVQNLEG
jgi:hypothetical protein